jgi:ribonuclease HII
MLAAERQHWQQGHQYIAGVDEAGRGPLAGPVVAAAVVIEQALAEAEEHNSFAGLTDSKKLSPVARQHFHDILQSSPDVLIGIGISDSREIDDVNILRATHLAMARALKSLPAMPDIALIDGRPVEGLPCNSVAMVGGDGKSLSIAAASVIAKVVRDHAMQGFDKEFPGYGFATHKGYGTSAHVQALFEHGPCAIHRKSFRPVREAAEILRRN